MGHFSIPNLENSSLVFPVPGVSGRGWVRKASEKCDAIKFQNIFKLISFVFQGLPFCIAVAECS